jgi:hypothetical protein
MATIELIRGSVSWPTLIDTVELMASEHRGAWVHGIPRHADTAELETAAILSLGMNRRAAVHRGTPSL